MDYNAELRNMVIRETMGGKPEVKAPTESKAAPAPPVTPELSPSIDESVSAPGLNFLEETLSRRDAMEADPGPADEVRKKVAENVDTNLIKGLMKSIGRRG